MFEKFDIDAYNKAAKEADRLLCEREMQARKQQVQRAGSTNRFASTCASTGSTSYDAPVVRHGHGSPLGDHLPHRVLMPADMLALADVPASPARHESKCNGTDMILDSGSLNQTARQI
jgi:hypothetical protein